MPMILNRDLVRRLDSDAVRELGIPSLLLMENAARGAVDVLLRHVPAGRIVILCGSGNNGGDGLAMHRLLWSLDVTSECYLVDDGRKLSADAATNLKILERSGIQVEPTDAAVLAELLQGLAPDDWIVDALLGTGLRGSVRPPYVTVVASANASAARILAVDIPTGLDCDTGTAEGLAIRAATTVTFVALKPGFLNEECVPYTGTVDVRHIGIPDPWLQSWRERFA
ncbi:MAG: NAD(P)H-hydrate epimerase [Planctomycetaceae bacterium]|nr:NAD(P)H-hydrate epimerase [Planctomycetaceae bacterium]